MQHQSGGDLAWEQAPDDWFTGKAWFGMHHGPTHEKDLTLLGVSFEPGARTDWHTHPEGQAIYIQEGRQHFGDRGCSHDHGVGDAGEDRDRWRNRQPGIDQSLE